MKSILFFAVISIMMLDLACTETKQKEQLKKTEEMKQTEQIDQYTFQLSDKVTRQKVTFKNRYGITLRGDLYIPKNRGSKPLAALALVDSGGKRTIFRIVCTKYGRAWFCYACVRSIVYR
jgi:hypothetical protein